MNVSEQWLREWITLACDTTELAETLTMAGLEVDEISDAVPTFSDVVVAQIRALEPHPHHRQLKLCHVAGDRDRDHSIVCGADNVRVGLHVALALAGTKLPKHSVVQAKEVHGVHSEGILCSASELGLSEDATGILEIRQETPLGTKLHKLLSPADRIIKLSITPNRGDCLSIQGLARELSLLTGSPIKTPSYVMRSENKAARHGPKRAVSVHEKTACPRYIGQIIEGVDAKSASPLWLLERLHRSGVRSVSPIVDITNYVMLELGQPLHAFADDTLHGSICVRYAVAGESLELLNGHTCVLDADTLVIADEQSVLAIAGVMGGQATAVTPDTRTIFLECAYFDAQTIRGKARRYGLHTDSAHRFERGVDFGLQKKAMARAVQLIVDICGGKPAPLVEAVSKTALPTANTIHLRYHQIERLLGITLAKQEVERILSGLGMQLKPIDTGWQVTVPTFRFDIAIEADLIEEIARIHGYHAIKKQRPIAAFRMHADTVTHTRLHAAQKLLVARGFQEVITYSFVDPDKQKILSSDTTPVQLINPISPELSVMRNSLIPGLVGALAHNQKRQKTDMRLFETGLVFKPHEGHVSQIMMIGGVISGNFHTLQWDVKSRPCDFFDLKRDVEALLALNGEQNACHFDVAKYPHLHPGQTAKIVCGNQTIGYIGALHPSVQETLKLTHETFVFELEVSGISKQIDAVYKEISKFPSVRRDLSMIVDDTIPASEMIKFIRKVAPDLLYNLELLDVYYEKTGESKINLGKKSVAFGLTFQQTSSTLTYNKVESVMTEIIESLVRQFGASFRG